MLPLIAGLVAACLAGTVIGGLAAFAAGWGPTDATLPATTAINSAPLWSLRHTAIAAGLCWLIAAFMGCLMFFAVTRLQVSKIPAGMLVSSGVRAGLALLNGIGLSLMLPVETRSFWVAFLACGIACLMWETVWSMSALRTASSPGGHS